jgi:Arc/MetJ-type ribon-helix-helix transcriptional regulator
MMTQVSISKPNVERYIAEQVASGRFASVQELVEAAVEQMAQAQSGAESDDEFDDEAAAAILRADAQCDRGEGRELADVASDLRKRVAKL